MTEPQLMSNLMEIRSSLLEKKYDLKELLAQIPDKYEPEEIDWGEPVGGEKW